MANDQTTPLSRTLPLFAEGKILDEIAKRGQALPGTVLAVNGSIVTVDFDVSGITLPGSVEMPLAGAEYIRYPVQVGDQGVAFPASVYIGAVSGLGNGSADLTLQGNLSTLVWFPIGNKLWAPPPNGGPDTLAMYGVLGLTLLDSLAGLASVQLTASGITLAFGSGSITLGSSSITLTFGGHSIVISGSGVTIDGKVFLTHHHLAGTYVSPDGAVTGNSGNVA